MSPLAERFHALLAALNAAVLGQAVLCERLLIALLAEGHVLLEGPPGMAKTRAVKILAGLLDASFQRVQFTPDLLPADLTGTDIFNPQTGAFRFEPGPLFHQLILADEINRAPAKVQSALLEAMAERQISVGRTTYRLPDPFLVMATQNPLEHEGTYALPEAQLDRFMLHVRIDYPDLATEKAILALVRAEALGERPPAPVPNPAQTMRCEEILAARREVLGVYLAPEVENYLLRLVAGTRPGGQTLPALRGMLRFGASPRAAIALERGAQAKAWLAGRDFVTPADIQALAPDVLRHRIGVSYEGEANGMAAEDIVQALLDQIDRP
ncbi:AAA family ATPase [Dechloromonas sp. A34]|uniref:AAA family ATPase n=1 Tax=Dechloromonas sp. A34 TaxID=447588 RepID=UPI003A5214A3